jgi:hypothetical protein
MAQYMDIIDLSPPGHQPRSLVVFRRARKDRRSPQYYARRLVPPQLRKTPRNPYLTKALGAVSLERAKELAWQWWTSTEQKINRKQSLHDTRFSTVAESYLRDLKAKTTRIDDRGRPAVNPRKYIRHEQSIRLHLNPFFGPMPLATYNRMTLSDGLNGVPCHMRPIAGARSLVNGPPHQHGCGCQRDPQSRRMP